MFPSTVMFAISLDKRELQGELLARHMQLICFDPRFELILLSLGDTLARHNLAHVSQPWEVSRALGDQWLAAAEPYLEAFRERFVIVRHETLLSDVDCISIRSGLESLFDGEPFRSALARDVDSFVARQEGADEALKSASREYILEELACDIAFARHEPFTHIYPGRPLHSYVVMMEQAERGIPDWLRGMEDCVFLRTRVSGNRVRFAGEPIAFKSRFLS